MIQYDPPASGTAQLCDRPGLPPDEDPSHRIRVCFLIDRVGRGGTEMQVLALLHHLDRSRFQPYLALLDGEDQYSQSIDLSKVDYPVFRLGVRKLLSLETMLQARRFASLLRAERMNILQVYMLDSTYFGVLAGRMAGVGAIVRTRNNTNHWMTPAHRRLGHVLNRFVTVTLCNSQAARDAVLADERPDPATVIVIENGVDLDRFASIPSVSPERALGRPRRVGMVANLRPVKGIDILVRAAARVVQSHPDVEFHVAGEGPQRLELEQLIVEQGLKGRFVLHGKVNDIPEFLASLDIAVLSSRSEGMPNAVLEYMAASRPIVATAVGGTTDLIEDQVHGRLVAAEDPEQLAVAIDVVLRNPAMAVQMGLSARNRAEAEFSRQGMARKYETFCLTLRKDKRP